jgi:hypothetical protein
MIKEITMESQSRLFVGIGLALALTLAGIVPASAGPRHPRRGLHPQPVVVSPQPAVVSTALTPERRGGPSHLGDALDSLRAADQILHASVPLRGSGILPDLKGALAALNNSPTIYHGHREAAIHATEAAIRQTQELIRNPRQTPPAPGPVALTEQAISEVRSDRLPTNRLRQPGPTIWRRAQSLSD